MVIIIIIIIIINPDYVNTIEYGSVFGARGGRCTDEESGGGNRMGTRRKAHEKKHIRSFPIFLVSQFNTHAISQLLKLKQHTIVDWIVKTS